MNQSVAVIGAGLSGLTVAYRLMQQGLDVHVYEARQRVGGRVFTALLHDIPIELGAQNILDGGNAENILKLIDDLQLTTIAGKIRSRFHYYTKTQMLDMDEVLNRWLATISQDQLKQQLDSLSQTCQNMAQVLGSLFDSYPELYNLFARRLLGYEGISVERMSSRYAHTLESMLRNLHQSANADRYFDYRIVGGGNARLVEKLREKLGHRIHLGMPLKVLVKTPKSSYTLKFDNDQIVEADRVVLAFPCSVYNDIRFEGDENLLARLSDIKEVAYGEHAKLMVPTHIPEDVYGFYGNDRFGLFSMATPNIVTMYYMNREVSFTSSTLHEVFARDHSFLEFIYRDQSLSHLRPVYARGEHFAAYQQPVGYNWFDDPYSRGTYSCLSVGQEQVFTDTIDYRGERVKCLFSPINDRLFFTGEHATVQMEVLGTMEAAVEAGERVARMMTSNQ